MKIGVIIPDRGDRPLFFEHCKYLLSIQTIQPTEIFYANDPPASKEKDITKRYRQGYDYFRNKNFDILFFMESDDWYNESYIGRMIQEWSIAGQPDLFGLTHTIYYHIKLQSYFTMHHTQRSSSMCTMIRPDMDFNWCQDSEPYTDSHLWMVAKRNDTNQPLTRAQFTPATPICLGIKHGIGLTGGNMHTDRLFRYEQHGKKDVDMGFLRSVADEKSFIFYSEYFT